MKNLSEKVLLVNLRISQWTARIYDEEVSMKVERDHSAHNAGRYTKILVNENALKETNKASGLARKFYYKETLPWADNGDRILPAQEYLRFMKEYHLLKSDFEREVELFMRQYPHLKAEAKYRLNGLFKEADYPDPHTVRSKFNMKIGILPINDLDDFRLKVNSDEMNHLRAQMEQEILDRVTNANRSLYVRIQEALSRMVEKLSQPDAIFRDTLVGNIGELIDLIPRLNFMGDHQIQNIIQDMKPLIVDPDNLRDDPRLRDRKAAEAKAILEKVSDFLG